MMSVMHQQIYKIHILALFYRDYVLVSVTHSPIPFRVRLWQIDYNIIAGGLVK